MITHDVCGEALTLLPERAIYWAARRTLLIADTHFGKSSTFRAEGFPVPHGTTANALDRLVSLQGRLDVGRIIFLGDFMHAAQGRTPSMLGALRAWRSGYADVEMILVRGNHDRHAGDPPTELDIRCVTEPFIDGPFGMRHHPKPTEGAYTLCGHLHPAAVLAGSGRQRLRLPCFWFCSGVGVLPSFGDFTGHSEIAANAGDAVYVIAGGSVTRV